MRSRTYIGMIAALLLAMACDSDDASGSDGATPMPDASSPDSAPDALPSDGSPPDSLLTDGSIADGSSGPDSSVVVPPGLLFFDDFEYEVASDAPGAADAFAAHGWAGAKTLQDGRDGARGSIYTSDTIPGYTGAFPGRGSGWVLVLEAQPDTLRGQTDFYLQYGDGDGEIGQIPANHWFQFWVYSPGPPEQNLFTQGKFIYPNRASFYPATLANDGYVYLTTLGKRSGQTFGIDCDPSRAVGCEDAFFSSVWNPAAGFTNRQPDGGGSLDQNLSEEAPVVPGRWTLVRMHVDVSGTDPRAVAGQAVYEQWVRPQGDAEWTKTTEWIGGVTVNASAPSAEPVALIPAFNDGFRMFRMPTTVGGTNEGIGDWYDYRLYVDDFALAGSEEELPVY